MGAVYGFGGFIDGMEVDMTPFAPEAERLKAISLASGYFEGQPIPEITKPAHDKFLETYKHIATERGTSRVEQGEPLPPFDELVRPYGDLKPGYEFWIGPPSVYWQRRKRVGVWEVEVGTPPGSVTDGLNGNEPSRDPYETALSIVHFYFDAGVYARDVTNEAKQRMARQLLGQGFIQVGAAALNHLMAIPDHDELLRDLTVTGAERFIVGPPEKPEPSQPGMLGIWEFSRERHELLKVDHINTKSHAGYPLDSRPARIPAAEKLEMVGNFLDRRLIPTARKLGLRPFPDQPDITTRDLASDIFDRHRVGRLMDGLAQGDDGLALGPALCERTKKDGTTREFVVRSGDSLAVWRYAQETNGEMSDKLIKLKEAFEKGHVIPQ